jgi:hypothetical protein
MHESASDLTIAFGDVCSSGWSGHRSPHLPDGAAAIQKRFTDLTIVSDVSIHAEDVGSSG